MQTLGLKDMSGIWQRAGVLTVPALCHMPASEGKTVSVTINQKVNTMIEESFEDALADLNAKMSDVAKQKEREAKAALKLYTVKARLLAAIFNPKWFPEQYKDGIHEIDHKFSIAAGFYKKVPLYAIGNRGNLHPVLIAENRTKRGSCSITLKALVASARYDDEYLRISGRIDAVPTIAKLRRWYTIYRQWHDGRLAALSLEDPTVFANQ